MSQHIEALSNGLGGPSMYLLWLACTRQIPATVSITADTGWEQDCLLNTGERMSAAQFFAEHVAPLAHCYGIDARFVRSTDRYGNPMPSLLEYHEQIATTGKAPPPIPMFGTRGGRSQQRCTQRYKVTAIRQELRRLGAKTQRSAQALHLLEAHRMKGANLRTDGGWHTWNDIEGVKKIKHPDGRVTEVPRIVKWCSHYYPLIDLRLTRQQVDDELARLSIPYIVGSQCDGCPHKNLSRWERTSPETIIRLADIERRTPGWYFTKQRVPLPLAIERMKAQPSLFADEDFGCGNAVCGL